MLPLKKVFFFLISEKLIKSSLLLQSTSLNIYVCAHMYTPVHTYLQLNSFWSCLNLTPHLYKLLVESLSLPSFQFPGCDSIGSGSRCAAEVSPPWMPAWLSGQVCSVTAGHSFLSLTKPDISCLHQVL
jgi:hypothetical protein